MQVQICNFVPSAVPGESKHLLLKILTLPPSNIHFWAAALVQPWRVTTAPSVSDAAVKHLAVKIGEHVRIDNFIEKGMCVPLFKPGWRRRAPLKL